MLQSQLCRGLSPDLMSSIHSPWCCQSYLSEPQIWACSIPNRAPHGPIPTGSSSMPLARHLKLSVILGLCMSLLPQLYHKETILPFLLLCFFSWRFKASGRKKGTDGDQVLGWYLSCQAAGKVKTSIVISQESMRCESLFPYSNINGSWPLQGCLHGNEAGSFHHTI